MEEEANATTVASVGVLAVEKVWVVSYEGVAMGNVLWCWGPIRA